MVTAVAALCLAALAANVPAEQVDPIHASIRAMGGGGLRSVRFSGFGAAYSVVQNGDARQPRPRVILEKYEVNVDYHALAMRVQLMRAQGAAPQLEVVDEGQQQIWMTPHGFLRAAVAHDAKTRRVPLGTEVSFVLAGKPYVGIIDGSNLVDRVHTWVNHPVLGEILVEVLYRDYEKVEGGLMFPTHIVKSEGGKVSLDVWLSSVRAKKSFKEAS